MWNALSQAHERECAGERTCTRSRLKWRRGWRGRRIVCNRWRTLRDRRRVIGACGNEHGNAQWPYQIPFHQRMTVTMFVPPAIPKTSLEMGIQLSPLIALLEIRRLELGRLRCVALHSDRVYFADMGIDSHLCPRVDRSYNTPLYAPIMPRSGVVATNANPLSGAP